MTRRLSPLVALVLFLLLGSFTVSATSATFSDVDTVDANSFAANDCFTTDFTTVQSGTTTSSASGVTAVAINAVNMSRAFLMFSTSHASNRPVASAIRGELASATTIEFTRVTDESPVAAIGIRWSVVEYACGITVQRGVTAQTSTTLDVAIAPVRSTAQAFVLWSKTPTATDFAWDTNDTVTAQLTTTSNLQLRSAASASTHVIAWQVIEFAMRDKIHVQQGAASITGSSASTTITLPTAVDTTRTFVLVDARNYGNGADIGERLVRAQLTSPTTIEIDRAAAGPYDDLYMTWQVVELKDGSTVQSGSAAFASGVSQASGTLNPVDVRRATGFGSFQHGSGQNMGRSPYVSDDIPGVAAATVEVTSSTAVTLRRASTVAAADIAWFVVEWGFSADVRKVQSGSVTNSANGTTTVTIGAVDPSKSFLVFTSSHNSARPVGSAIRGRIASSTTLEFARVTNESPVSTITVQWYVVEYSRGVSVQRGEVTQSATAVNVPITPVGSTGQAFVLLSKTAASTDNEWGADDAVVADLTSTSNLQIRADQASGHPISWQVIEFTDPRDATVQRGSTSLTGTSLSTTVTLPAAVDTNRSFVLVSARGAGSGPDIGARLVRARLTDATTITIDRGASGSPDDLPEIAWQVVHLADGSTVQSGSAAFASGTSQVTAALTSVDTTRLVPLATFQHGSGQNMGKTSYVGDDITGVAAVTAVATSSTQLTLKRANTAGSADVAWSAVLFGG